VGPAELPVMAYVWLKAFHIIAVIAWMAGLFYLPRLFAYHADAEPHSEESETFKIMERRLLRIIMNPAMMATWVLGLLLAWIGDWWTAPWFLAKLALVVVMTWFHSWLGARCRDFAADGNRRPASTYRILNELPTILVIAIVILVVVKPF
jgi:protoporphyrinogen IX oxidase